MDSRDEAETFVELADRKARLALGIIGALSAEIARQNHDMAHITSTRSLHRACTGGRAC